MDVRTGNLLIARCAVSRNRHVAQEERARARSPEWVSDRVRATIGALPDATTKPVRSRLGVGSALVSTARWGSPLRLRWPRQGLAMDAKANSLATVEWIEVPRRLRAPPGFSLLRR